MATLYGDLTSELNSPLDDNSIFADKIQLPFQPAIDGIDHSQSPKYKNSSSLLSVSTTPDANNLRTLNSDWQSFEMRVAPSRQAPPPPPLPFGSDTTRLDDTKTDMWISLATHTHQSTSDSSSLPDYKSIQPNSSRPATRNTVVTPNELPFRRSQSVRVRSKSSRERNDITMQPSNYDDAAILKGDTIFTSQRQTTIMQADATLNNTQPTQWNAYVKLSQRLSRNFSAWYPVFVKIEDSMISISEPIHALPTSGRLDEPDIFKDIILQHLHSLSEYKFKKHEKNSKMYQIKLQQVSYVERRTMRKFFSFEHVTRRHTVVKFGFKDIKNLNEFQETFNDSLRRLPVTRQQGVAYNSNEIFVEVNDYAKILMSCDGGMLERITQTRIYIQAFLTGAPQCRLLLNDLEAVLKQRVNTSLLTTGATKLVHMERTEIHPCVDNEQFSSTRDIVFYPVDACKFELLRCNVDPHFLPPVQVSGLMEFKDNIIYITSSLYVRRKLNLKKTPIKELKLRFPVPPSWRPSLKADTAFGERSVRSTARSSFKRNIKSQQSRIVTSHGTAKFQPEIGIIEWTIGNYEHTSHQYTFLCEIEYKSGMQNPNGMQLHADVSYTMTGSSLGLSVRSLKIDQQAERWVRYAIIYNYKVQMFPEFSSD